MVRWRKTSDHPRRRWPLWLAGAIFAGPAGIESAAADSSTTVPDEICSLVPGLQGRIEDVDAEASVEPLVYVDRGDKTASVKSGCLLKSGDRVRTGPGTKVTVTLPDGQTAHADFNSQLIIPATGTPSLLDPFIGLLREWAGADAGKAEQIANATIGATRDIGDTPPIVMPGMRGVGRQFVAAGRPVFVRWVGGAPPYQVSLFGAIAGRPLEMARSTGSTRLARLDLGNDLSGGHELTIAGASGTPLTIRLHVAAASEIPSPPGFSGDENDEGWQLARCVWLLTDPKQARWRLEALSCLQRLALEQHNFLAQAIIHPAPEMTGSLQP